jgi:hypothetical protein
MEVDWNHVNYELFGKIIPKVVQTFFGMDLNYEKDTDSQDRARAESFLLSQRQQRILGVIYKEKPVDLKNLSKFIEEILGMGTSAGLIVSASPQPFRWLFFERSHGCWFPIAIWGRKQVDSIASLNKGILSEIIPFVKRLGEHYGSKRTALGKGGVVSSDIVEFTQQGVIVGAKIGQDPAKVRIAVVRAVDDCFSRGGGRKANYWQKVGSDGWFHFYDDQASSAVVPFAIRTMVEIRKLASYCASSGYLKLQVVMGLNVAENVQLDPLGGGPLDNDSIISWRLTNVQFSQYDIRATKEAVSNLVEPADRINWIRYGSFVFPINRQIEVLGHA